MQLNPQIIRLQIENLKVLHPALVEDDEAWQMSLESETDISELLTTIVRRIEDTKALVIGTKDRFEELKARKDRFEHRIEALRELAFKVMETADLSTLELAEATLSIRNTPSAVVITNEDLLPDSVCKFERKPDKTKIKEWLNSGLTAAAGAVMSNGSKTISIRVK